MNLVYSRYVLTGKKLATSSFANHGTYWESLEQIPEPHGLDVTVTVEHGGHAHTYETQFAEHDHGDDHDHGHGNGHGHEREPADDPLYARLRGDSAVLTRHIQG
jgi:hypothetical protein